MAPQRRLSVMWLALHGDKPVVLVERVDWKRELARIGHRKRICGEQENSRPFLDLANAISQRKLLAERIKLLSNC